MKVIMQSGGLDERAVFNITHGKNLSKVSDNLGRVFDVSEYIVYADTDRQTGTERQVLAMVTEDGDILSSNSATVIRTFLDMVDVLKMPINGVEITSGQSKSGRTYYDLKLA